MEFSSFQFCPEASHERLSGGRWEKQVVSWPTAKGGGLGPVLQPLQVAIKMRSSWLSAGTAVSTRISTHIGQVDSRSHETSMWSVRGRS